MKFKSAYGMVYAKLMFAIGLVVISASVVRMGSHAAKGETWSVAGNGLEIFVLGLLVAHCIHTIAWNAAAEHANEMNEHARKAS